MFQIMHTEKNHSAGLMFGHTGMNNTRAEGVIGGYETRDAAVAAMIEMQDQARANGAADYADALHIEFA